MLNIVDEVQWRQRDRENGVIAQVIRHETFLPAAMIAVGCGLDHQTRTYILRPLFLVGNMAPPPRRCCTI